MKHRDLNSPKLQKPHWHLICYDITSPRRIQKVHKFLKKQGGLPLQKSVFAWHGDDYRLEKLIRKLERLIKASEDDLRIYPIRHLQAIDLWGKSARALANPPPEKMTAWQRLQKWISLNTSHEDQPHD